MKLTTITLTKTTVFLLDKGQSTIGSEVLVLSEYQQNENSNNLLKSNIKKIELPTKSKVTKKTIP